MAVYISEEIVVCFVTNTYSQVIIFKYYVMSHEGASLNGTKCPVKERPQMGH